MNGCPALPMPQMSDRPAALAWKIPPAAPVTALPGGTGEVPGPRSLDGAVPLVPNSQTSVALMRRDAGEAGAMPSSRPAARSARPSRSSSAPSRRGRSQPRCRSVQGALAAVIQLCAPDGRAVDSGTPFVIRSAFGLPWSADVRAAKEPRLTRPGEHDVVLAVVGRRGQIVDGQLQRPRAAGSSPKGGSGGRDRRDRDHDREQPASHPIRADSTAKAVHIRLRKGCKPGLEAPG